VSESTALKDHCEAFLESESVDEFNALAAALRDEHQPTTPTEHLLVQKLAQHHWLSQRALRLQCVAMGDDDLSSEQKAREFALYLRYQTTNDRGFQSCLNQLLKLRAERRKAEIGFESQKRQKADEARKAAAEKRKQELHKWHVTLAEMKATNQELLNSQAEPVEKYGEDNLQAFMEACERVRARRKSAA
jgi:hypothetical protein